MYSPENSYIKNADGHDAPPVVTEGLGFSAEDVVIDFFNNNFEGMTVRSATSFEDSGVKQIERGKQIDAVAYYDGKTAMGIQITTARDPKVQNEKLKQMRERPIIRLAEMAREDVAIPKVLIGLDPEEVQSFLGDHDLSLHPKITEKILKDTILSLKFDLTQTKNQKEQDKIKTLLDFFESKSQTLH